MRIWRTVSGVAALGVGLGVVAYGAQSGRVVRQIEDRACGTVWLLMEDPAHPGGPGRLVRQNGPVSWSRLERNVPELKVLVIRAGERVAVEEHSAAVDAVLDAVAMEPARAGSMFRVRLKPGGQVLRVVAVAPGRAMLAAGMEGVK